MSVTCEIDGSLSWKTGILLPIHPEFWLVGWFNSDNCTTYRSEGADLSKFCPLRYITHQVCGDSEGNSKRDVGIFMWETRESF